MASVATVYTARQLVSATALKLYVCAASLVGIAKLVWVARVWENMAQVGVGHTVQFMLAAALNTHALVQLTLVVFVIAGVSLFLDLARSVTSTSTWFA